jgi:tetratricopeptide (TPR) repeat protein
MRLLSREASLARDAGAMVEAALLAEHLGSSKDEVEHLAAALHADPGDREAAGELRGMLGDDAPRALAAIYEKVGHAHADDKAGAVAWAQAAAIELQELNDAPAAFFAAGRALSRDPRSVAALELRADAAEAADRRAEAAEALQKLLELLPDDARAAAWTPRLGRLYADLGEPAKALALLTPTLDTLSPALLLKLAPGAQGLAAQDGVRVYRRLLEVFPAAADPAPTDAQLAQWSSALAARHLSLGQEDEALQAFRRVLRHDPHDAAALRALSESGSPEEAIAAQRAWLRLSSAPEPLHALVKLFLAAQKPDAAFCAAAALSSLRLETPDERAIYQAESKKPPPVEPPLADGPALRAEGDEGPARELLAAAAAELPTALPTEMSAGRGALVKGDNPVRRVVAALARALGMPEPQLFLARGEPGAVTPVAGERAGLLVGAEVPRRFSSRQQRFLYARALAHIRRGTHPLAGLSAARLATTTGELIRLAAPHGTDFSQLPRGDAAVAEALARHIGPEARARLAELAARAAAAETDWEALALGIRESAERAGLVICADPAAALAIVSAEAQGGLEKPEVSRLVRFAVGDGFLAARAR